MDYHRKIIKKCELHCNFKKKEEKREECGLQILRALKERSSTTFLHPLNLQERVFKLQKSQAFSLFLMPQKSFFLFSYFAPKFSYIVL